MLTAIDTAYLREYRLEVVKTISTTTITIFMASPTTTFHFSHDLTFIEYLFFVSTQDVVPQSILVVTLFYMWHKAS